MALNVTGLAIERGGRRVVSDVAFSLAAGDALLITGANGAGKSTLLRAMAGLLPMAAGRIDWIFPVEGPLQEAAHYVGHKDALKSVLTLAETLRFWARALAHPWRTPLPVPEALAEVGLGAAAETEVTYLSAGQRRRAALARLLVAQRPVWLLDEPSSALDAASQGRLDRMMATHRQKGGIVIAATHLPLGLEGAKMLRLGDA
ncbi:heme ABC exporter ATP-binding protein CcmA [Methylovirgula sp. 4M-Z18]|nr:heme ABC exporter ATP-binding protein CcmA [Methylovirgula sp. 4M-Z18]RFB78513.1 heme ABC exporter ATP-binding protein CcmA [Methylovirgula sp. 4M-Z18]